MAREFPRLHILGVAHCKKVKTEDPFDSILGSMALRAETDTNIVLYEEDGDRIIATETRMGRRLEPSILRAEIVMSAGAEVAKDFFLDGTLSERKDNRTAKVEKRKRASLDREVIAYLEECDGCTAPQTEIIAAIKGRTGSIIAAIHELTEARFVSTSGRPLQVHLELSGDELTLYRMGGNAA